MTQKSRCILYDGFLHKRGHFVKSWRRRYFELGSDNLSYYKAKDGKCIKSFPITVDTTCEDSNLLPFCFRIATNENEIFLFARDTVEKGAWIDAIHSAIHLSSLVKFESGSSVDSLHTKLSRRGHNCAHEVEKVKKQRVQRPQLFIKVIQARNLLGKDLNGSSDPYTQVTVGSNIVVTKVQEKDLNPIWGQIFTFDFDQSLRFAKVEVWDRDPHKKDEFLGRVLIPLADVGEEKRRKWYGLGKRSERSRVQGEIEIEMFTNIPKYETLFASFTEILSLPEIFYGTSRGVGSIAMGQKDTDEGFFFPRNLPANEFIEDLSVNCLLKSHPNACGLFSTGLFFLTNYRIIFVSNHRLQPGSSEEALLNPIQLTTTIPIGLIASVIYNREMNILETGMNLSGIKIKCRDGRFLSFIFYTQQQSIELNKAIKSIICQCHSESIDRQSLLPITQISALGSSLSNLFVREHEYPNQPKNVARRWSSIDQNDLESSLSGEGPSHSRILARLQFRILNPGISAKICMDAQDEYLRQFQNIIPKEYLIPRDHFDNFDKDGWIPSSDSDCSETIDSSEDEDRIYHNIENQRHIKLQKSDVKTPKKELKTYNYEIRTWIHFSDDDEEEEANQIDEVNEGNKDENDSTEDYDDDDEISDTCDNFVN